MGKAKKKDVGGSVYTKKGNKAYSALDDLGAKASANWRKQNPYANPKVIKGTKGK